MRYPEIIQFSPNFDSTPRNEALGVIFHHSVDAFFPTIAKMLRPDSKVSYHVLIAADGARCRLVRDEHIAWHAGASQFLGRSRCNDFTLGAGFAGNTHVAPLTDAQIASALEWLEPRWTEYKWSLDRLTDHRQVAPGRKDDLNPTEWEKLKAAITARFAPSTK